MRQTHIKQQTHKKQSQNDVQYKAAKPKKNYKKLFHLVGEGTDFVILCCNRGGGT